MTTLTTKPRKGGGFLCLRENGDYVGRVIYQPAKVAGVSGKWNAMPDGAAAHEFFSRQAAELYITAFAADANYIARHKENGGVMDETIFQNGTMYGAKKGEAA